MKVPQEFATKETITPLSFGQSTRAHFCVWLSLNEAVGLHFILNEKYVTLNMKLTLGRVSCPILERQQEFRPAERDQQAQTICVTDPLSCCGLRREVK